MYNKITLSQFVSIVIATIVFSLILVVNPQLYDYISREDHLIEYGSAFFLLLTSFFFFGSFIFSKKHIQSIRWSAIIFLILGIVFFLAAGEEISWAQRIFDIQTPEYLAQINDQNELNIHNINKKFFDRVLDRVTILFTIIGTILVFYKKEEIFTIKTPDIFIICAFAITPFYVQNTKLDFYHIQYIPLFFLLLYSIKNKLKVHTIGIITTMATIAFIPIMHTKLADLFPAHNNSANEYREFLFCLCCVYYSYFIMSSLKMKIQDNSTVPSMSKK